MLGQVLVDGALQIAHTRKAAASNPLLAELVKPPVDKIQPRRSGRSVVQMEAPLCRQPRLHLIVLVRGVVIDDQVQGKPPRRGPIQRPQELQKLLVPMPTWRRRGRFSRNSSAK